MLGSNYATSCLCFGLSELFAMAYYLVPTLVILTEMVSINAIWATFLFSFADVCSKVSSFKMNLC
jgi:hypothetical protein